MHRSTNRLRKEDIRRDVPEALPQNSFIRLLIRGCIVTIISTPEDANKIQARGLWQCDGGLTRIQLALRRGGQETPGNRDMLYGQLLRYLWLG